ncbi:MAG: efflux RND transporter periplasmic adaptor subunit [Gammaproteobacteria bacterium]
MSNKKPATRRRLEILSVTALSAGLVACGGGGPPGGPQMPPAAVSVAEVVQQSITDWDEFTGRVEAVNYVEIRPRVAGYLDAIHFREGGVVNEGDLLFTIDDREYVAAINVARANLVRAETRVELAEQELERSERLIEARAISAEELDQRRGERLSAVADVNSAQAQLVQAELNLSFANITAPITGRIGAALIRPGNLVAPGETLLTTLVSIDPVYVTFEGDEDVYLKYEAASRSGDRPSSRDVANPVQIALAGDTEFSYLGEMDFVDNQLDPTTGTIRGRAVVPNADDILTPGLFARVRLLGSGEYDALLIHDMAVLTDQDRKYVYIVGEGNTAERRDVVLGREVDGLRVVTSGLSVGDRVVVNGVRKIFFPGAPIAPDEVPMNDPLAITAAGGSVGTATSGD